MTSTTVSNPASLDQRVAESPQDFRVLTGERPTGKLHIGHYFGSLLNRVSLQNRGVDMMLVIADYQVLTDRDISADLQGHVHNIVLDYLAVGLDPARTTMFVHSAVPALHQLLLPFLSLVSSAELERNPTVKEEIAAARRGSVSGLMYTYPAHQAADILFCHANLVPVGDDQLPHVELTRTIARRFNQRYQPLFEPVEPLLSAAPRLLGIDGNSKMSKSQQNTIPLSATEDETAALITKAVTDTGRHISYDPEYRPQVSNLVLMTALCTDTDPYELADQIGDGGAAALKRLAIEALNEHMAPIRRRRREFANEPSVVNEILASGNARANELANRTLDQVHRAMGTLGTRY